MPGCAILCGATILYAVQRNARTDDSIMGLESGQVFAVRRHGEKAASAARPVRWQTRCRQSPLSRPMTRPAIVEFAASTQCGCRGLPTGPRSHDRGDAAHGGPRLVVCRVPGSFLRKYTAGTAEYAKTNAVPSASPPPCTCAGLFFAAVSAYRRAANIHISCGSGASSKHWRIDRN